MSILTAPFPRPGGSAPLSIALVGLSEQEASYVLQRLAVALPDVSVVRFDSVEPVLVALHASQAMPVLVAGSRLGADDRRTAGERARGIRPCVAVLDIADWQAAEHGTLPRPPAESLVAVAVRSALLRRATDGPPALSEADVAEALSRDQLELHYQPIVDLTRREVVGLEALVRWRHPALGLLPPEVLLPLAENAGLTAELGRWVLTAACRQAARWHQQGLRLEMGVNVSARQLADPDFAAVVREALAESSFEPGSLMLEVTESAVMEDAEAAAPGMTRIRSTGAALVIDDFGTGYSSMLHLKRDHVRALKVDTSFIAGLGRHPDDDALVAGVVGLAGVVGAVCGAEGVETSDQLQHLASLGCQRAQGFLFSPPVPASQVPAAVDAAEARARAGIGVPQRGLPAAGEGVPAEVVRHMMQMYEDGASYPTIAAALNRQGSLHPKGTRWHLTSVARFISDLSARSQKMP